MKEGSPVLKGYFFKPQEDAPDALLVTTNGFYQIQSQGPVGYKPSAQTTKPIAMLKKHFNASTKP